MNGMANNNDDSVECPLCMEPLEVDDLTFFPCTCGYQICRFCWHRIRTDENKLCPACRKEYPENPADFKPLSQEEMIAFKSQKRQRDQQRKQKITENRKHLANVRVVQKNLVFVVGLPPRLADADILKKHEYFGKYGKIHKVVINPSTTYAGVQGPSASAYVTYVHNTDALRAIQSVNNIMIDGRLIKTSLGTTKYCSHFMKNQQCPKGDCMYLHELGDSEASFTKEEMHQGKHQEYEKRLHDVLIATSGANSVTGIGGSTNGTAATGSGTSKANAATAMSSSSSSSTSSVSIANNSTVNNSQQKEAWPSLSVSPVNSKETIGSGSNGSGSGNGKSRKEKLRSEKTRHEKNKSKSKQSNAFPSSSSTANKENFVPDSKGETSIATSASQVSIDEPPVPATAPATSSTKSEANAGSTRQRSERNKERGSNRSAAVKAQRENVKETNTQTTPSKQLEHSEEDVDSNKDINLIKISESTTTTTTTSTTQTTFPSPKRSSSSTAHRSPSSSSEISDDHISESSTSGKSSPGNFKEARLNTSNFENHEDIQNKNTIRVQNGVLVNSESEEVTTIETDNLQETCNSDNSKLIDDSKPSSQEDIEKNTPAESDGKNEVSDTLSKLDIFDDSNSFFSSSPSFQQSLLLNKKLEGDVRQPQINNGTSSHLPDLLNGIDGYQKTANTNEWEEAFKNVMIRNTRQVEEQVLQQQHLQLQQQHHHQQVLQQQEEFLRMHEFHKRNNLVNNIGIAHTNGLPADFPGHFPNSAVDANRTPQPHAPPPMHQPPHLIQPQPEENQLNINNVFGGNMSKFFDFHKSQQQLHHQYMNGHSMLNNGDSHRLAVFLENSRVNPSLIDSGLLNQQSQVHKQRLLGAFDKITPQQPQNTQSQQNRFSQNSLVDDDLGFDPFTETQKGLAELMENEVVQQNVNIGSKMPPPTPATHQQIMDNMHRARMPPPGFNHMNTLGFDSAARVHSSKILPFINMPGNTLGNNPAPPVDPQQQHQMQMATNWNNHMASLHQQQHQPQPPISDSHLQHQMAQAAATNQNKGYGNSDWTAMDPAILSFRQFSSFPHQGQIPSLHQQQQDLLLQHLAQNQQQNGQGFSNQSQQMLPGMNLPNNLINGQSSSQTQVNANVQGMLEFLKNRQFV